MNTKTCYWSLISGGNPLQETAEEKRKAGLEYIDKLKSDGENVIEVIEREDKFIIILEDKNG